MKVGAIVQARCGSSRLQKKVLLKLPFSSNTTVLEHIIRRVSQSELIEQLIIATTNNQEDDQIANFFPQNLFRGDESHVLSRYYLAAKENQIDVIVRITGDNPCINATNIDTTVRNHISKKYDYSKTSGLPLGTNIEVISFSALEIAYFDAKDTYEIEHVTPYILRRPEKFKIGVLPINVSNSLKDLRLTLDYPSDYAMLNIIFSYFDNKIFSIAELEDFMESNSWVKEINRNYQKQHYSNEYQELEVALNMLEQAELKTATNIVRRAMLEYYQN